MSNNDKFQREVEKRLLNLEKVVKGILGHIESLKKSLQATSPKKEETISAEIPTEEEIILPSCLHYFGYLRFHPKTETIPNECLICQKLIECFKHSE